jgi:DNA replication protein DnaC
MRAGAVPAMNLTICRSSFIFGVSAFAAYALGGDAEQRQQLRTLIDADLLVLDDLFLSRRIGDKAAELLQTLVYKRYKLKRSIVVTSNRVVQDWGQVPRRQHHGHHHHGPAHVPRTHP